MNLNESVFSNVIKNPRSIYFDDGISSERECYLSGTLIRSRFSSDREDFSVNIKKASENVFDMYVGSGIRNCIANRTVLEEYNFQLIVNFSKNEYYIVNDFENCSDELPLENNYMNNLDYFPEILKLMFINPPSYVGYMM